MDNHHMSGWNGHLPLTGFSQQITRHSILGVLKGLVVRPDGLLWGHDGEPIGKIVEGDLGNLEGETVDENGWVVDQEGFVIGKADVLSQEEANRLHRLAWPDKYDDNDDASETESQSKHVEPYHAEGTNEPAKESTNPNGTVTVGFDYLKKLENMITDLQLRAGPPVPGSIEIIGVGNKPKEIEDATREPKLEVLRLKESPTYYGDPEPQREPDVDSPGDHGVSENLGNKNVLTIVREFDERKRFWKKKAEIASPALIKRLHNVCHYETDVDTVNGDLHLTEPLMVLFHNREQLTNLAEDRAASNPLSDHAKVLVDFMRSDCPDTTKKLDDIESANPSGLITWPDVWMLYRPGTIVYTIENGEREAFVVDSIRGMQKRRPGFIGRHSHSRMDLTCWSINYDGEIYGRVWSTHCILPFHGTKEIASLDLVPAKFLPEAETTRADLIARGKKFWGLQGQKYLEYTGEMWTQQATEDEAVRVMVDHLAYQRRNDWPITIDRKRGPASSQSKNWRANRFNQDDDRRSRRRRAPPPAYDEYYNPLGVDDPEELNNVPPHRRFKTDQPPHRDESEFNKYDRIQPDSEPGELTLLLCPQQVHGYCLRDKVWKDLNITQLRPVSFRKNAWDCLVLDAEYKDIVQAVVSSYVDKTAMLDDLVAGKGKGLVALLHGAPGSGKTLTAECVADSYGKPLYHVTCGDIGTDPEGLEERLEEIFDYAVTFGAILLLDEADIFLQDRDYTNLERNALVSIFLRQLEYFKGVLFLTTNRVGMFDQAFQSRIHVTLGLPSLDQERRMAVWSIFLQDLTTKGAISEARYDVLMQLVHDKWSKEKLNGRQIRNAVRTALVVAEKRGEMVGEKEFETVLRIGREFEGYMGSLGGKGVEKGALEGFMEVERP
ncbi:hypothetical protein OEA41_001635 [Lepraria neglecta]|uniref:AAA+ ATPase domain-containing protein n=1 Tax=Lepraria neglecta TaxID=209136 RepID=A0AAE0DM32_9LECA|nr:hypothetical protein OEA41_001635 [Lepraria neglecta]